MNPQNTLVLFTGSYPYDIKAEQTFLGPEIHYLCREFDRIIIVPSRIGGKKHNIPSHIIIDESFAINPATTNIFNKISYALSGLRSFLFYQDVFYKPSIFIAPTAIKALLWYAFMAGHTRKWLIKFVDHNRININTTVFYTYWLNEVTLGVGLTKHIFPKLKLISRAHGGDLYEDRNRLDYIPCRRNTLRALDSLCLVSEAGRDYLIRRYPWVAPICDVFRLGVLDPGFTTRFSTNGIFRIVSCSFLIALKRVDLLLKGIACLARSRPNQFFEWHHLGDGPLRERIEKMSKRLLPFNVKYFFRGLLPNEEVMSFYRKNPIDVYILVSQSEGIPVSIMEAQSCGIPVIATDVGGVHEIVSEQNGILLGQYPSPDEIAEAVCKLMNNRHLSLEKGMAGKNTWQTRFNAEINYTAFSKHLRSMIVDH